MVNEPKRRKGKRSVEWGSPRYYQEMQGRHNPRSQPARRKRDGCKKLKGPHEYGPEEAHILFGRPVWYESRCIGCGKKHITRVVPLTETRDTR